MYYTILTNDVVYQPESIVNSKLQQQSNIKSNWDYRKFMQQNATNIMKHNTYEAINSSGNNPYANIIGGETDTNPFLYLSTHDSRSAKLSHPNTDLRQSYLEKEQFKSRMISPSMSLNLKK